MNRNITIVIIFTLFLIQFQGQAQVVAGFDADKQQGCDLLFVKFSDTSSGTNLSYSWDFGNGTVSTLPNPQVYFSSPGKYTVRLIVSDGIDIDTLRQEDYIEVNKGPQALFSADVLEDCAPLSSNFTNNVVLGDTTIADYIWDFNDGVFSTNPNESHVFTDARKYSVSLYVLDNNGCESIILKSEYINAVASPEVQFTATNTISCLDTNTVQFSNTSTDELPLTFQWSFGDGQNSGSENPDHFYSAFNNYTVALSAENSFGCSTTISKTDLIQMQPINADFALPNDSLCRDVPVAITNNSVGATSFQWLFGDGTASSIENPIKTYTQANTFEITLVAALQNFCTDTVRKEVWIDPVQANFESDINYACELPFNVNYSTTSEGAFTYDWRFGNGEESNLENPEISYESTVGLKNNFRESYTDTLIVTSELGCNSRFIVEDNIEIVLPEIKFGQDNITSGPFGGCIPLTIDFIDESINNNSDESLVSFAWDFGDGQVSTEQNPSHIFTDAGDIETILSVTNSAGCVNTYKQIIYAGSKLEADFSMAGSNERCGNEAIQFNNLTPSLGLIDEFAWTFSDSTKSNLPHPELNFIDTGYIKAQLVVNYNYCASEPKIVDSIVRVKGPTGRFNDEFLCDEPRKYNFISNIVGADSIYWDFGDGTYDSTQTSSVDKTYAISGSFTVKVHTLNNITGCVLDLETNVTPRALESILEVDTNIVCKEDTLELRSGNSQDYTSFFYNNAAYDYLWVINEEIIIPSNSDLNYVFPKVGVNTVRLQVSDVNRCISDSTIQVRVFKPQVNFEADVTQGCTPMQTQLSDLTTADTTIGSWEWLLGTTSVGTDPVITTSHTDTGFVNVSLKVEDILGCETTYTKSNYLFSSKPQPDIQVLDYAHCYGDSIQFNNLSKGVGLSQTWYLGDGNTSNSQQFWYKYNLPGKYELSIYQSDTFGCDTTYTYPDSIYVEELPVANFSSDIRTYSCYPALIQFNDQSSGNVNSRVWIYGDNSIKGYSTNPLHTYVLPDDYSVGLSVSTPLGCSHDTVYENYIKVKGPYAQIVAPDTACINTPYVFDLDDMRNLYSSQWFFDDGSSQTGIQANVAYPDFETIHYFLLLKADTIGTCDKVFNDSIVFPELIADFAVIDSAGCVPLSPGLTNLSLGSINYAWFLDDILSSSEVNPELSATIPGIQALKLVAYNRQLCADSATQILDVYPLPTISTSNDTLICVFDTIALWADGGVSYQWLNTQYISDQNTSFIAVNPQETDFYVVEVTDTNTCVNLDSILVNVQQVPIVSIDDTEDKSIIIGEELMLNAELTYASNFYWEPSDYVNCSDCYSILATPLETGYLVLQAQDDNNCFVVRDSVYVDVDKKYSVDVPNAFTPNSDGVNDIVWVKGWGIQELLLFEVYNKFGKKVYESNDLSMGWDGVFEGGRLSPDVYYYRLQVQFYDGETQSKSGEIYLLN